MSTTHPYKYHPQTAESVVTAQQSPGMDASSAAAWSWSRVDSPIINRHAIINSHTINSHTADNSYLAPTEAGAAVQQVVVHKKMRKATGPPPLESFLFKRMCRRPSASNNSNSTNNSNYNNNNNNNNNNNVVAGGRNYSSTFQRSPAYRTAATANANATANAASAMETLRINYATAAAAAAAPAMETMRVDRATATAGAAYAMETLPANRPTATAIATAATMETLRADPATATATAAMQTLPMVILKQIGAFAGACFPLGETCKANLELTSELHYSINIMNNASSFSAAQDPWGWLSNRHMLMGGGVKLSLGALSNRHNGGGGGGGVKKAPGALATGRIVTRITVTGCTDLKDTHGGYQVLEEAVKRVVQRSIPTLRSITVKGRRGRDSPRVAAILGDLASLAANRNRVAPNLVRVELHHGATAFSAAGKAIEAGLWPALEELVVPNCHAKLAHARRLVSGLSSGRAANLRVLVWDEQASTQHEHLDNAILAALSVGRCPRIERLSFANPKIRTNPSYTLLNTILACPGLRELRLTRKSMSTQRVFYVTCRASRLEKFRQKLATARRAKRLGV